MLNFELKKPILGQFWGAIKILSTHNLFCRKIATFSPAYILVHDSADSKAQNQHMQSIWVCLVAKAGRMSVPIFSPKKLSGEKADKCQAYSFLTGLLRYRFIRGVLRG